MTIDDYKMEIEKRQKEIEDLKKQHLEKQAEKGKLKKLIKEANDHYNNQEKALLIDLRKQESDIQNFDNHKKEALKIAVFVFVIGVYLGSLISPIAFFLGISYWSVFGVGACLSFLVSSYKYHIEMKPLKALKRDVENFGIDFATEISMAEVQCESKSKQIKVLETSLTQLMKELKDIEISIKEKTNALEQYRSSFYEKVAIKLKNVELDDSTETMDGKSKTKVKTTGEIYSKTTKVEKMADGTFRNISK